MPSQKDLNMDGGVCKAFLTPDPVKWYDPRTWCGGLFILIALIMLGMSSTLGAILYGFYLAANYFGLL